MLRLMRDMLKLILVDGHRALQITSLSEAEIVALATQLNVLRRKSTKRLAFSNFDRLIFAGLFRIAPNVLNALSRYIEAGDCYRLASCGFSLVLEMEVAISRRQAKGAARNPPIDP